MSGERTPFRELREGAGLTLRTCERLTGLARQQLLAIQRGDVARMRVSTLVACAWGLGVRPIELFPLLGALPPAQYSERARDEMAAVGSPHSAGNLAAAECLQPSLRRKPDETG